ncbi:MAG: sigma factor-like helix-turn-helix DNA-binding protein [Nanoarchaeota archaeon]|nr:sigma factor-like helix-turn-helix DNA-binding protein [Nanoarchaeota archaeon]
MEKQQKEERISNLNSTNTSSQNLLEEIKQKYNITEQQLTKLLNEKEETIPIYVFNNETLSSLETIVKYLKENKNQKHSHIAKKLNRNVKTIWATYQKARQKQPEQFEEQETGVTIPTALFCDRTLSILEHITKHLKENHDLSYTEIAKLLNRSPKTIWTVYQRAKKKKK